MVETSATYRHQLRELYGPVNKKFLLGLHKYLMQRIREINVAIFTKLTNRIFREIEYLL